MSALAGKRILVTRAAAQAQETAALLTQRGALPRFFPCLEVRLNPQEVRRGIQLLSTKDGEALFTSANGVEAAHQVLGDDFAVRFGGVRTAAVGRKTAEALTKHGVEPRLIPDTYSQEGLLDAYRKAGLPKRLVFFRASEGRDLLAEALRAQGVRVDLIKAYGTVRPEFDATPVIRELARGDIDAVLLASAKTARFYVDRIGDLRLASRPAIAAISPQVASVCAELGLTVQAVAEHASLVAMLDALEHYFEQGDAYVQI